MSSPLQKGRNCCSLTHGSKAKLLIDADCYFAAFETSILSARRSIIILGWDFDARISLHGSSKKRLGELLRELVEKNPALEVRILIWSFSVVHSPGDPVEKLFGADWQNHPRITLRLDREHPFYASQHQKIVVIDENIAFTGGIDFTVGRWDRLGHRAHLPRRNPDGTRYGPVHDVQIMVDGSAADALAEIARTRWQRATGEILHRIQADISWPKGVTADFESATAAISCTYPAWHSWPPVKESFELTKDLFRHAKRSIYVEAQYFTAQYLADVFVPILEAPVGPEVILNLSANWHSKIERLVLGRNCERLLRKLKQADRHGRLLACFPELETAEGQVRILIHAKVIIIDDELMRIGSSNLNNRSIALDSECDLTIHARSAAESESIVRLRNQLLAEHLAADPTELAESIKADGSIIRAMTRYNKGSRKLVPFNISLDGPVKSVFGTGLVDPSRPFRGSGWLKAFSKKRLIEYQTRNSQCQGNQVVGQTEQH